MDETQSSPNRVVDRARAEYLEMPGLRLTVGQAARLWNLDLSETEHVLGELAADGLLLRDRSGSYRRRGCPRCC